MLCLEPSPYKLSSYLVFREPSFSPSGQQAVRRRALLVTEPPLSSSAIFCALENLFCAASGRGLGRRGGRQVSAAASPLSSGGPRPVRRRGRSSQDRLSNQMHYSFCVRRALLYSSLARFALKKLRRRPTLPHGRPCSTIGAGRLNFRVRDGIGCDPAAIATGNLVNTRNRSL